MQTLTNNMLDNNAAWLGLTILDRAAACIESGRVNQALDDIFTGLRTTRDNMSDEDWAEFARYARENHELGNWIYQDPMTRRAYEKPRGYAGDAVMMATTTQPPRPLSSGGRFTSTSGDVRRHQRSGTAVST
jgi:hypothetical protein